MKQQKKGEKVMFSVKVPLDLQNYSDPEKRRHFCEVVKAAGGTGVLLVVYPFEHTQKDFVALNEAADYFQKEGLTVSVWYVYSLGHGNFDAYGVKKSIDYNGKESNHAVCPMQKNFIELYTKELKDFVRATKDYCRELYFDDDYRINWICSKICKDRIVLYSLLAEIGVQSVFCIT